MSDPVPVPPATPVVMQMSYRTSVIASFQKSMALKYTVDDVLKAAESFQLAMVEDPLVRYIRNVRVATQEKECSPLFRS